MTRGYPGYTLANALRGLLIYGSGDTFAALILGEFSLVRMFGVMGIGATLYALEVPNWFFCIDRWVVRDGGVKASLKRTLLALLYFNPLWIARHLWLIGLLQGTVRGTELLWIGLYAFLANIPITFIANYLIQNHLPLHWRFSASALFSALMAIYYAAATTLFGH